MTKESIYQLQKIDCNCNDCAFFVRDLNKLNSAVAADRVLSEEIFNITKQRKIDKCNKDIENIIKHRLLIKNADQKIVAKKEYLNLLNKKQFVYQAQECKNLYGHCNKFNKAVEFQPNTCQLDTQLCFVHRKNFVK